jgi:hypothetical protein
MQQPTSFARRVIGTVTLDRLVIETIERDNAATTQAAILVTLVAFVGALGGLEEFGWPGFVVGIVLAFAGWLVFSGVAYMVGMGFLSGDATEAEAEFHGVLRTVGFAQVPDLLVVFTIVPGGIIGGLLSLAGSFWVIVCAVVALHVSLKVSIPRAILIGLIAAIVSFLFGAVVLLIL